MIRVWVTTPYGTRVYAEAETKAQVRAARGVALDLAERSYPYPSPSQCRVMVELATALSANDPELKEAYGL